METLQFSLKSKELFRHVPSLAVLRFTSEQQIHKIFKNEGELCIIAARINENTALPNYTFMEIYFTTGLSKDQKKENTIKHYIYSFQFNDEGGVINFSGVNEIQIVSTMRYFTKYSEDKIYCSK